MTDAARAAAQEKTGRRPFAPRPPTPPSRVLRWLGIETDRVTPENVGQIAFATGTDPSLWLKAQTIYDTWSTSWACRRTGVEIRSGDIWRRDDGARFLILGFYTRRRARFGHMKDQDTIARTLLGKWPNRIPLDFRVKQIARTFVLLRRDDILTDVLQ